MILADTEISLCPQREKETLVGAGHCVPASLCADGSHSPGKLPGERGLSRMLLGLTP